MSTYRTKHKVWYFCSEGSLNPNNKKKMAQCFPPIYFNQLINKLPPNTACLLLAQLNSGIKKPIHEVCFARTLWESVLLTKKSMPKCYILYLWMVYVTGNEESECRNSRQFFLSVTKFDLLGLPLFLPHFPSNKCLQFILKLFARWLIKQKNKIRLNPEIRPDCLHLKY